MNRILANLLLSLHAGFVLFVIAGLVLTWIGWARRWGWARNFWFRLAHLLSIGFVAIQALCGAMCPLTVWEDRLRGIERPMPGFIERWLSRVLYYDLPGWVFIAAYVGFGVIVLATFIAFPPRWPGRR